MAGLVLHIAASEPRDRRNLATLREALTLAPETAAFKTMGQALDSEKSGISYGEHHSGRPLLTPDEVRTMPQTVELLFLAGQRPIVAGKLAYYADPEFSGLFDQA